MVYVAIVRCSLRYPWQHYPTHPEIAADACNIESRLIRGTMNNENHAWNVVKINKKHFLVDVTNDPDQLMEEGDKRTDIYKRQDGSIGGKSIHGNIWRFYVTIKDLMK
jgi:hypothetical protein